MKYIETFENRHHILKKYDYEEDLFDEIQFGNYDDVVDLIENKKADINCKDVNTWTPLIKSTINNRVKIAEKLIELGADINQQTIDGKTALMFAAESNLHDMIILLIESGAELYIKDDDGNDFFYYLTEDEEEIVTEDYPEECEEYLIKKNAEKFNL